MHTKQRPTRALAHLLPCALLLSACGLFPGPGNVITGSGQVVSETRAVSGLTAVALRGQGEVVITQGATEGLTIEAEDNLLPLITSEVDGGTLALDFDRANWADSIRPTRPIRFQVMVRDLTAIDLSGAGDITTAALNAGELEIYLSGSGDITVEALTTADLRVSLSGAGNVTLAGVTGSQAVEISGAGDYAAGELESQSAEISLSGTGNITAWVEQTLSIRLSGSGTVNYFGQPTVTQRDITGAGDINPMGSK